VPERPSYAGGASLANRPDATGMPPRSPAGSRGQRGANGTLTWWRADCGTATVSKQRPSAAGPAGRGAMTGDRRSITVTQVKGRHGESDRRTEHRRPYRCRERAPGTPRGNPRQDDGAVVAGVGGRTRRSRTALRCRLPDTGRAPQPGLTVADEDRSSAANLVPGDANGYEDVFAARAN
jgi:hypothetical protein